MDSQQKEQFGAKGPLGDSCTSKWGATTPVQSNAEMSALLKVFFTLRKKAKSRPCRLRQIGSSERCSYYTNPKGLFPWGLGG